MKTILWAIVLGLLATAASAFNVQVPYSGQLAENGELVNGTKTMKFQIADGTATVYDSGNVSVTVSNGAFSVSLGGTGLPALDTAVFSKTGRKLRVFVNGTALTPDVDLPFAPYAAGGDHSTLQNLTTGDPHTQYFERDGSDTMGGDLKLGGRDLLGARNVRANNVIVTGTVTAPAFIGTATSATYAANAGTATQVLTATISGDANTLDSIDSASFLRSDASASFTNGVLTINAGTTLGVEGALNAANATSIFFPANAITDAMIADSLNLAALNVSGPANFDNKPGAPFRVLSAARVDNLNAHYLDGLTSAGMLDRANHVGLTPINGGGTGAATSAAALANLGAASLNAANSFQSGNQLILTGGAARNGLTIQGAMAQTANLLELRDSAGVLRASISPIGIFTGDGSGLTNLPPGKGSFLTGRIMNLSTVGGTTEYAGVSGLATPAPAEVTATMLSPNVNVAATQLAVKLTAAPGAGMSRAFALRVNGVTVPLGVTISGSNQTGNSGTAWVSIPPASEIAIQCQTVGAFTAPSASGLFSLILQ